VANGSLSLGTKFKDPNGGKGTPIKEVWSTIMGLPNKKWN